jgi:hypothetical protein
MNIYIVKSVDDRNDDRDFRFNLTIEGAIHSIGRLVYDYLDRIRDYRSANPASLLTAHDITQALKTGQPVITLNHTFKIHVDIDTIGD